MRLIDADALEFAPDLHNVMNGVRFVGRNGGKTIAMVQNDLRKMIDRAPTVEPVITGDTSDGYHTFNELYHHRAVLFSVIVKAFPDNAWKAKKHHDGSMYEGMFIVGIETPAGQATYHYDIDPYWDMFRCKEVEFAPEWDGHTPQQAIERIGKLEPVRHWEWVKMVFTDTGNFAGYKCSDCGLIARRKFSYCHCGAKMDGGAK